MLMNLRVSLFTTITLMQDCLYSLKQAITRTEEKDIDFKYSE